jgi:small subunit ribosomal protein S4
MRIGPKYKIARRLGAPVFEKTQTQKYALRTERKVPKRTFGISAYGKALKELQKVRFGFGTTASQLARYAKEAIAKKGTDAPERLFRRLEMRLDSAVLRAGLVSTRQAARQAVSHGHVTVNGTRVRVPSALVKKGDVIAAREGSKDSGVFRGADERLKNGAAASWLKVDLAALAATVAAEPQLDRTNSVLDFDAVIQHFRK